MIWQDGNIPWVIVINFSQRLRQLLVDVKRSDGTTRATMQARVRLSCMNSLLYMGHHTFWRQATNPQEAAD